MIKQECTIQSKTVAQTAVKRPLTDVDDSQLIAMSGELSAKNNSSMEFSVELIEDYLKNYNLARDQIAPQNLLELKQSLITLNSLLADIKNESPCLTEKSLELVAGFDSSYILLILIQRKGMILEKYRRLLKKFFFDKIKGCLNQIQESSIREQLKVLLNKLEYIENNGHNISGYLQNYSK